MIRLAIRRPVAVTMAYICVALLGFAAWRNLPIELYPDTDLPQLSVRATWPDASPEVTEAFLTAPLEAAIQQVRGVRNITSTSSAPSGSGVASISVEFARETDMEFARLELSERLEALYDDLPPAARRSVQVTPYVPEEFDEQNSPLLRYTTTGPYTDEALAAHIEDVTAPLLRQVDGVAAVEVSGGRPRVLEVEVDRERVRSLGLEINAVSQAISSLEFVGEAGRVETGGMLRPLAIRHRAESMNDILSVPVQIENERVVRLRDVGTVHDRYEEATSYYRIDGDPAVSFRVYKEIGSNAVATADRVKERLAEIESSHLPGMRLILDADQSEDIRAQFTDLRSRAIAAAIVIFFVLLIFLRSVRSAGIVFATIAFSILITINLVYFAGFTLNTFTIMGLAMGFGLIVDNAIVVLENIFRRRRLGEDAAVAAETGARDVVLPILAATLTTVVVLVPFVYLQDESRIYYVPLALVVGFSLLASLFVAFSFIPALGGRILQHIQPGGVEARIATRTTGSSAPASAGSEPKKDPLYVAFYSWLIRFTLRHPWVTVTLAALLLGGSYYFFDRYVTRNTLYFGGRSQRTEVEVRIQQPRGVDLAQTDAIVRFFEERIAPMPEVEQFVTTVQPDYGRIVMSFPDSLEWTAVPLAIQEQMVAFSHEFGGTDVRVIGRGPSFYGGGGSAPNYRIQILGYNYETVRDIAEDLGRRLARFSRVQEVDTNANAGYSRDRATELVLELDRSRLALFGLTAQSVIQQVGAAVGGRGGGGTIRVDGEELRYRVKFRGHREMEVIDLEEMQLASSNGGGVRLGSVATLYERGVLSNIRRENQQYERTLAYEFRGPRRLGDAYRDTIIAGTELPPGYEIEERSYFYWSQDDQQQIYMLLAVSLMLVFMVAAAVFESVRQPLCVLLTVPMALVGVFLTFFYANASFTREGYIGVIMMGGIVVNNAILLVDHVNQLRRKEGVPFEDAIVRGTLDRVRPILMTSATTIFGLLPLVLFSETADSNIWNALAYALIGGLGSATIFTLAITPALYYLFERRPEKRRLARLARRAAAPAMLVLTTAGLAGCGAAGGENPGVVVRVDTLESGTVVVRNAGRAPVWPVEELATIGRGGGMAEAAPDEFGRIVGIAADEAGRIYVADAQAREIRVFDEDGTYRDRIGRRGGGPGEFESLQSMSRLGDGFATLDPGNGRLGLFTADGDWRGERGYMALGGEGVRLYRTRGDEVYMPYVRRVGDESLLVFVRHTPEAPGDTILRHQSEPPATYGVLCRFPGGITSYRSEFAPRVLIVPAPDGLLAEAWSADYRIAYIDASADTVRIVERDVEPFGFTGEEWAEEERRFEEYMRDYPGAECEPSTLPRPEAKDLMRGFFFDEAGRLWVERRTGDGFVFDVFDLDGHLIGEVPVPERLERVPPFFLGDRVYLVTTDEFGIEYVRAFRLAAGAPTERV